LETKQKHTSKVNEACRTTSVITCMLRGQCKLNLIKMLQNETQERKETDYSCKTNGKSPSFTENDASFARIRP
jgi:hypothetical protein